MEKKSVSIENRIALPIIELALKATLDGSATPEYFYELARTECSGENRAKKIVRSIKRLTINSKLLPFLAEHQDATERLLKAKNDRPLLFVAMMCASYTIYYDAMSILGKFFHVQDQVTTDFLRRKLAEIYGSNRALFIAIDCIVSTLLDTGFITRPRPGVYEMVKQEKYSDEAKKVYVQSFLLNNPTYSENDDIESNPYFEFIN